MLRSIIVLFVTVASSNVYACDKGQVNQNFLKLLRDDSSTYDLKFLAMTVESAKKYSSALEALTDTYREYFAKEQVALDAIKGCDRQTIIDAAVRGAKK